MVKQQFREVERAYSIERDRARDSTGRLAQTMTQHTSRLCKGYLTKKESDGVLHQMTWPPQSPDLNPIEMVWDELDRRVKEKQPTNAQHMWELLQDCWKTFQVKLVERIPRVCKSVIKAKGGYFENLKYILICLTLFLVTT
ncbi:unnamed protein product [Oncorhynchus mykiss]|uniref:Tc1-like transposase DDE domain-containing protein n=1 Tax=Oncorhynchus mykiss TaxID=8022 RepID=A0A060Z8N3_ONCMY|nr:unnamed protein product [Oncorhynchus mykiss]